MEQYKGVLFMVFEKHFQLAMIYFHCSQKLYE